jgi:hypothetical protein
VLDVVLGLSVKTLVVVTINRSAELLWYIESPYTSAWLIAVDPLSILNNTPFQLLEGIAAQYT